MGTLRNLVSHFKKKRPQQSRAIVLNRFGLALIVRIAPDRSDAQYVSGLAVPND